MFDVIIKGGNIIDGTGKPSFWADVGIVGDRIRQIGNLNGSPAKKTIDAEGLVVCPGFVDIHSHADVVLLREPLNKPKVMQGVSLELEQYE